MNTKLILGTAQFGLNYGINNTLGKPCEKDVFEILDVAHEQGLELLETADAYGNAITLIGQYHNQSAYRFKILNKFKYIKEGCLYDHAMNTLDKLHMPVFEVYSYHSFSEYSKHSFLKDELLSLKSKGLIKQIGISLYTNTELKCAILDKDIDVIQLPYNLLDNRNKRGTFLEEGKLYSKEIHIRSVFLQGLLFMEEKDIPEKLSRLKPYLHEIHSYCEHNEINLYSLALSYAVYTKQIDRVLIGVETKEQLMRNMESMLELKDAFDFIDHNINVTEKELLNPGNWK